MARKIPAMPSEQIGRRLPKPQPPLLNCPKCRTPLGPDIELCCSCGVKVRQMASVDRPPLATDDSA